MFGWNAWRAVGETFFVAVQLLQIARHCLRCRLKQASQLRFDVRFPLRTKLSFLFICWRTEEPLFGSRRAIWVGARRNLPKQFGQERVQFRDLDRTFAAANLHVSLSFR